MAEANPNSQLNSARRINYDPENVVLQRYQEGARNVEAGLCCPTDYDDRYLKCLPKEILEKDYGCGDPTRYISTGETVLDLGSGVGKNCYIAAQKVGAAGQAIGVDFNDEMLAVARKYLDPISEQLGYCNVKFLKGRIQDLKLDVELAQAWLADRPITSLEQLAAFETECDRLRQQQPLIADCSVDIAISNCVLNLVRPQDKQKLFQELYRVLKQGGRVVISDIVCDEDPTPEIIDDPNLWSGCIAGAFREDVFLEMFERAGFYGIEILNRQEKPWQVINGIEFRSLTVRAYKGKEGPCWERNQAVIYKGPWQFVRDDDNHCFERGKRSAICDKTYRILTNPNGPYHQDFIAIPPYKDIPLDSAKVFDCKRTSIRHPQETKGLEYRIASVNPDSSCCESSQSCC